MRNYKISIIFLIIFAILLASYLVFTEKNNNEALTSIDNKTQSEKIIDIKKETIKEIKIATISETIKFVRVGNEIKLSSPSITNIDQNVLDNMLNALTSLSSEKLITSKPTDILQFGFTNEAISIIINYDNSIKTLLIGSLTPSKDYYYIKTLDNKSIFTISKLNAEKIMVSSEKLKSKVLFNLKAEEVNYLMIIKNSNISFEVLKKENALNKWEIKSPVSSNADDSKIKTIINSVIAFKISEFVQNNNMDLSSYGLEKPSYLIEIHSVTGRKVILAIGNPKVNGESMYAKFIGEKDIFILDQTAFDFGDKSVIDIISKNIYTTDIDSVTNLEIINKGKNSKYRFESGKINNATDDKFYLNNELIKDTTKFQDFFASLINIEAEQINIKESPKQNASVTIIFTHNKYPGLMKIEFISKDELFFQILKNGRNSGLLIKKDVLDNLLSYTN